MATIPIEQIYEIRFHESTHTHANPYRLDIIPFFPDERFAHYLQDICYTKRIVIYETIDTLKAKLAVFGVNKKRFHIDRIENILKAYTDRRITENDIIDVDLTTSLSLSFPNKKEREHFQKQFDKSARRIVLYEYKNYVRILNELNLTPEFTTINHSELDNRHQEGQIDYYDAPYVKEVKEAPMLLEDPNKQKKKKIKFFK